MISFLIPEKDLPYNPNNLESVLGYAKKLEGNTLRKVTKGNLNSAKKNKGGIGQLTEELYFFLKNNSSPEPDFENLQLELKTAGLNPTSSKDRHKNISGKWKAKEALSLSSINYNNIIQEEFILSSFLKKNENILLIFHKYEKLHPLDLEIKLTGLFAFNKLSESDKEIIKNDWELMKSKTLDGKAHEFSRGDFEYLELATSGTSSSYTTQPRSDIKARTRKYSFKAGFMHSVIAKLGTDKTNQKSLFRKKENRINISEKIKNKFKPYVGMDINLIASSLGITLEDCKHAFSLISKRLVRAIFDVPENENVEQYIEEFSKAEITIKTIRVSENNLPKEHISFPAFKYENIIQQSWDDSEFKKHIDKKFLFIFFKESGSSFVLDKAVYWNMSAEHIKEAQKAWEDTKKLIKEGRIVREIKNGRRYTYFPDSKSNLVSHVRPHAKNAQDTYSLPVTDIKTGLNEYTKHCFWLNREYVKDYIYESEIKN
jgi:DNA mismatch repair protein MutH